MLNTGAVKPEPGAAARQQRLLPLLRMGLAGSASALLPNSLTTMRLAVDAVSPAARIVVRLGLLPVPGSLRTSRGGAGPPCQSSSNQTLQ